MFNILEACRYNQVKHLVYASSSSVYGANTKVPYSVEDKVDNPVSLYAATKKVTNLWPMLIVNSIIFPLPVFVFTVYGPLGRPDMAYFSFTNKLIKRKLLKFLIMEIVNATLHMLMILLKVLFVS